ncbi:aminopeptidase N-like [Colias croceus]|uniref:aminopeptidase N-like n=1 Tax=Colias crocea TaxID=72248 RepID=UPI001E27BA3D|nr:aminopeptidase N-like [Colias croceus]
MGALNKIIVIFSVIVSINSLPLRTRVDTVTFTSGDVINPIGFQDNINISNDDKNSTETEEESSEVDYINPGNSSESLEDDYELVNDVKYDHGVAITKNQDFTLFNQIRDGMVVTSYEVTLEPRLNDGTFNGVAILRVQVQLATAEDPLIFHFEDLSIDSVLLAAGAGSNFGAPDDIVVDDGLLEINTGHDATLYTIEIRYRGSLSRAGIGLYSGSYETDTYVAMNLHPTNARRVFPCIDEPNVHTTISFNFAGINNYQHVIANSILVDPRPQNEIHFTPMSGVPHLWGMVAHNMNALSFPIANVALYARPGRSNQDSQASVAISNFFSSFNTWTGKDHDEIVANQDGRLHIMAMPDVDRDWYALSTICIWEPYVLMETGASVIQRKTGLVKLSEAISRQWFGYVMVPDNWRYQWVVAGLGSYAANRIVRDFQTNPSGVDDTLIDMNAVFVSDVIQESLLNDGYRAAIPLEAAEDIFDEDQIRENINGLVKTKAPAILHMLSLTLSKDPEKDHIKDAASALLQTDALSNINSRNFYDTVKGFWDGEPNKLIDNVLDFMESWTLENNYPIIRVGLQQTGVFVSQERFGYSSRPRTVYMVPLTYTSSVNPNFDNIYPVMVMESTVSIDIVLDEEDWVLFNIQGQGYYRVNYENELWERIIEALEDPERRAIIHPINRATLVDDALNLARAGKVDYDIAFRVVLTMEHETEYVVWKAFIRSMDFLRTRLLAYVDGDDDLDPAIYRRMVRRSIVTLENELGFTPEVNINEPAMTSLVRGLVMRHACVVGYQPCIAAAIDWFRDPNNKDAVNPNIPADLRPAVFCANVMSGGEEERSLLFEYMETVNNAHERVVILESLACSQDNNFIQSLLDQTIAANSPYSTEERSRIFKSVVSSTGPQNVRVALNFLTLRTIEIRNMYGGPDKLEEVLHVVAKNLGDRDMVNDFTNWVKSRFSELDDSETSAERAVEELQEDLIWTTLYLNNVYEWIDENDAHTMMVSVLLIALGLLVSLFNQY